MIKVSVIIPVYNVEQTIEQCAHSLFSQTMTDIELIFVDDCSSDNSIEKLLDVKKQYKNWRGVMRIISNPVNSGVAYSREVGMRAATGEYIIHCDSDDWVEHDMYENMYKEAKTKKADIVTCDHIEEYDNKSIVIQSSFYSSDPKECIKHYYECRFPTFLWSTMIERKIIVDNDIYPYKDINTGEDLNVVFRCFYYCHKNIHVPKPFYHYIRHEGSLSLQKDYNFLFTNNIYPNVTRINDFFEKQIDGEEYTTTMNYLKFQKKMFLLQDDKSPMIKTWWNTWRESNHDIPKFKSIPLKTRIIFGLCSKSYMFLWIYIKVYWKFFIHKILGAK